MIPNFFIIGAPKCGTTALSQYLSSHSKVFLSSIKEPHYFAKDFLQFRPYYVNTKEEYLDLFAQATKQHIAIGEASVWYMLSKVAVCNIHQFNPNAKIIIMLRNPIDMVYSLHSQFVFSLVEDEPDFEKAWFLQEARAAGINLPKNAKKQDRSPELLQYGAVGKFGQQLEKVYSIFPKEQVKVILFDEFKEASAQVYRDVLTFLNVPCDGRKNFQPVNENKFHKLFWMAKLTQDTPESIMKIVQKLGFKNTGLLHFLNRLNIKKAKRKSLSDSFRSELGTYFSEDMRLLSQLINRDLDHWL
jgi:hypothetical protein